MAYALWRILVGTLCGSPIALVVATALERGVLRAGIVSAQSYMGGTILHEVPFVITVFPLFVALAALIYVGGKLVVGGRAGLPDHPRAVTWLILAVFISPLWLLAIAVGFHLGL